MRILPNPISEDQGPWRPGNLRIYSLLQKYSPKRALRTNRMEVIKRIRPSLSPRRGGWYGTTGHPSGGRTDGFPVIWGPLLITRHLHQCRLTLVVYQWQVGTFELYNGRFPNRTLYLQNVPTCHSSASPGEWLISGSLAWTTESGILNKAGHLVTH